MKFNGRNIYISPKAKLGRNVRVGDNTIIYDGVEIGDDSTICNNVVLGEPLTQYFNDPDYVNPVTIVGAGALIRSHAIVYAGCLLGIGFTSGHRAYIREHTHIGDHCMVGASCDIQGFVQIGNYCRLHSYIRIARTSILGDFVFLYPFVVMTADPCPPSNDANGATIDNYSQVAVHSVILPGVHIGENCFVGANSVVSKSIPPFSMALGNPARRVMDVRRYRARGKEHLYPWMTRFERGMPWAGIGFDAWSALQHPDVSTEQDFDPDAECKVELVNYS